MRRTWLRGRENVHKRYLLNVAGYNLGLLMRLTISLGTPRGAAERLYAVLIPVNRPSDGFIIAIIVTDRIRPVAAVTIDITDPTG